MEFCHPILLNHDFSWKFSLKDPVLHQNSKVINVSEDSASLDDKFHFVLEASRRSNTTCLQLYSKEVEAFPGESAASSILSRQLNGQPGISETASEKVSYFHMICSLFLNKDSTFESAYNEPFSGFDQFQDIVRKLCTWRDLMVSGKLFRLGFKFVDFTQIPFLHLVFILWHNLFFVIYIDYASNLFAFVLFF